MCSFAPERKKSRVLLVALIVGAILAAFFLASVMASLSISASVEFSAEGITDQTSADILVVDGRSYLFTELPITLDFPTGSTHNFAWLSPIESNSNKYYAWVKTEGLSSYQSDSIDISFFDGRIKATYELIRDPISGENNTDDSEVCFGSKTSTIPCEGGCCGNGLVLEIYGKTGTNYLRTAVGAIYEGTSWNIESNSPTSLYNGAYIPSDVQSVSTKTQGGISIETAKPWEGFFPVPMYTNQIEFNEDVATNYYSIQHLFYAANRMSIYYLDYTIYDFTPELLRNSQLSNDATSFIYLQMPESLRIRVQYLLEQIGISNLPTAYDKIIAIKNFLQSNYQYDLNYTHAPKGTDPVEWFLFEEKRGVCANFNSAFVILLRASGIPSRMVAGYAVYTDAEYQKVLAKQAHAWAEIKFENIGWVTFDATGSGNGLCCLNTDASFPTPTPSPTPTPATPSPPPPSPSKIPTITEITELSPSTVKGGSFTTVGTVTDQKSLPVTGLKIVITIKKNKADENGSVCGTTEVNNGRFNATCQTPTVLPVGDYNVVAAAIGNEKYERSESDPIIRVKSETKINTAAPASVFSTNPLSITTQLIEKETEIPLSNAQITLNYNGGGKDAALSCATNQTGYGVFSIQPLTKYADSTLEYSISFKGTDYYLPSQAGGQVKIQSPASEISPEDSSISDSDDAQNATAPFYTSPFFFGSIPLSILAIGFVFLLLRKKKKNDTSPKTNQDPPETPSSGQARINAGEDTIVLEIVFPQITFPFPDKWGVNENLTVQTNLRKNDAPQKKETVKLVIDDKNEKNLTTNDQGVASTTLKFKEKGLHLLKAEYKFKTAASECVAKRVITIIDYTEEVVEIFNNIFVQLKTKGALLTEDTTPREFQNIITETFSQVNKESLDELVSIFEIAEYSLSKLNREEYEKMYLASRSVKKSVEKTAGSG